MALRLLALAFVVVVATLGGVTWRVWVMRDAIFLTPEATNVRNMPAGRGVQLISYRAAVGWRAVIGRQLEQRGWSVSMPVTPAPQNAYYRLTDLWIGHMAETAALGGGGAAGRDFGSAGLCVALVEAVGAMGGVGAYAMPAWGVCNTPVRVVFAAD